LELFSTILKYINSHEIIFSFVLAVTILFVVQLIVGPEKLMRIMLRAMTSFFLPMDSVAEERSDISGLEAKLDSLLAKVDQINSSGENIAEAGHAGPDSDSFPKNDSSLDMERLRFARRERLSGILNGYGIPRGEASDILLQLLLYQLADSAQDPATEIPIKELMAMRTSALENETKWRQKSQFDTVLAQHLGSAASIRRAMLNLFVLVNIILVSSIIFRSADVLSNKEIILGLYVSFATFIVYVYRSSNARALILLAGVEDNKRYHDADKYLEFVGKRGPNERDIEALKILLVNRMEREKNAEHPYELVMKGISNSNILMKGGKIASVQEKVKPGAT
jgi:hypothetical protein